MQVISHRLKWSIIGLLTIPYVFIILCGALSFTIPLVYDYTDTIMLTFLGLVLLFSMMSLYNYRLLKKLKKKTNEHSEEEVGQSEEGVNEFANVIGKDTHFVGNIQSSNDVLVLGKVSGEIKTTADVYVDGMVEGSITCRNLAMNDAIVNADIICYKEVRIDALSVVRGNVHTDVLLLDGKIKGNIDIEGHMELSKNCVILGDILAREIALPPGAQIHGNMNIKK